MPAPEVQFAHLEGLGGSRISLGWRPRDARQRLSRDVDWTGDPWLQVHGEITSPQTSWSFVDPALTEHEARDLADFLDLRPWSAPRVFECTEPCLAFTAVRETASVFTIEVRFRFECAPRLVRGDDAQHDGALTIALAVTDAALRDFTRCVRGMLGMGR